MPKVTLIGAGSTVFARNLMSDCLSYPALNESTYVLYDIDESRLETSYKMAQKVAKSWNANPKIIATTDPYQALEGADYAINMIQVGGYDPCTITDFEIPKKYGLRQTIADTLGIGGIFRALRTIPVMIDYGRIMEDVCPDVTFLNYVNPMAMNTWAMLVGTEVKTIGLCHSVQGSHHHLIRALGIDPAEVNFTCAGINHMAFYLTLEHKGEDLYPRIFDMVGSAEYRPDWDKVRLDMMMRIGYYITESSEHFSEYGPWHIKRNREDLIEQYHIPLDEYPRRCVNQIAGWSKMAEDLENGIGFENPKRSVEYGSLIINAMETNVPTLVHGSVLNNDLIDNLPKGSCVEVPCLIDRNGIQPLKVGNLPPVCAALDRTQINVQELAVYGALTGNKEYVYQAAMMDPHTAAELSLEEIWNLVDDLFEAHEGWLPQFEDHGCGCGHDHGHDHSHSNNCEEGCC